MIKTVFANFDYIKGSHINIYCEHEHALHLGKYHRVVIRLVEERFRRYGDDAPVDREHFMMTLADMHSIMIRASFVPHQTSIRLHSLHCFIIQRVS